MPPRKKRDATPNDERAVDYRYTGEKRTNIPPARMAGEGTVPTVPKARYAYSPHLPPTLQFDPTGEPDKLDALVDKATKGALSAAEATRLKEALRVKEPTLEWAGKREQREKGFLEVDPVALHIHERVSARAIIRSALREDVQRELFADPQQPYKEAVQFYKHDVDWANRLILGDSLQVMSSLVRRENLAGKVQMIFMDPPYGVQFRSNFQSVTSTRNVGSNDEDLTREPEMIKAYRDTWRHGVHSYLEYLRQRFILSRELLGQSGSFFLQISDDNVHLVRQVLDEIFGPSSFVCQIAFTKGPGGLETKDALAARFDYLLWYARDHKHVLANKLYVSDEVDPNKFSWFETPSGCVGRNSTVDVSSLPTGTRFFADESLTKPGPGSKYDFPFQGRVYNSGRRWWGTPPDALARALRANRAFVVGNTIRRKKYYDESPPKLLDNLWDGIGGASQPVYVVQTNSEVIKRCMLMTTRPGDLVLDPTCGSGTTAFVAESFGRRWITTDTSRVALVLARQRLLTSQFPCYEVLGEAASMSVDPSAGFRFKQTKNVTFSAVSQNKDLDPILDECDRLLDEALTRCNRAIAAIPIAAREAMNARLQEDEIDGEDIERARTMLPLSSGFEHWTVPFEVSPHWPTSLQGSVQNYRTVWSRRIERINREIEARVEGIDLIDRPIVRHGVLRVSGPFSVEGVRPEELNLDEAGLVDHSPNEPLNDEADSDSTILQQNLHAYLLRMVQLIRRDGVTFLGNSRRMFSSVEPLFDAGSGTSLHAEGAWLDSASSDVLDVAIGFGPQYGPVTAQQVESLIHSTKRHKDLVIAGFSFDADATAMIQEQSHPKLRIHQAYIRPDVNPGMDGLLKETLNSQLFTVFGTPEIELSKTKNGEHVVELKGVDIYDPVANTVRSSGADKVAAWFLDSDFDGRCFCVTQAFFPDQDAWEKIAKALGSAADADAFEAFKGTTSIPFAAGTHKRIAVKVIDPRGNEVMVVRALEA